MEQPEMNDQQQAFTPKKSWRRRFLWLIILLLVVVAGYHLSAYWYPKVQQVADRYSPWHQQQHAVKHLTPIQQLQQHVNILAAQNQQLQLQQHAMQMYLQHKGLHNVGWILSDTLYLVRLADYQTSINHNAKTAITLLKTADQRLASLDNPHYQPVRQVIAKNIMQLQALPKIDVGGMVARLTALSEQTQGLQLVQPKIVGNKMHPLVMHDQSSWKKALHGTWHSLRDLIVVRKLNQPMAPLLTQDQKVNLNLHMAALLQQAQWAVLHRNQQVYQLSLAQTQDMVNRYFIINQAATKAVLANLQQLVKINVAPTYPHLSTTVMMVKHYSHNKPHKMKSINVHTRKV